MNIKRCRNCNKTILVTLFSLGKIAFSGIFAKRDSQNIKKTNLTLVMCKACKLVQLRERFNKKTLYGENYGYRTGINQTMTDHVEKVAKKASKIVKLKKNDQVLDIASNDGTLLKFYKKNIYKCGIDPLVSKYKKYYKNINCSISAFFHEKYFKKNKFKIITALSVFYDLEKPNLFLSHVKKIMHQDGIFVLEFADLRSILKFKMFDTICHEHLEYYSSKVIFDIVKKNKLRVFDHEYNNINGKSSRYYICHEKSDFKSKKNKLDKILHQEKKETINNPQTFKIFFNEINKIKDELNNKIKKIKLRKKIIHGYGASTKGNVLLQYFSINKQQIDFIADRNPMKKNQFTPGTKIKIITEKKSRKLKPNYYLVLPWHFKREILEREKKIRASGTKFIFPLPKCQIL
jgi:hypothetical protein